LLEGGRALGTGFIWFGMFMNLMIYFFLQKWLTQLLVLVGLSQADAITATTVGLAGGIVAAFILGPLMDRFGPYIVVSSLFAISALSCVVMGQVLSSPAPMIVIAASLFVGFCLSGGQKANNALSVYFYPTALRGPGLGWSLGIGRLGGVLGPLLAGWLLEAAWNPSELFYAAAVPMLLGSIAIAMMGQFYAHTGTDRPWRIRFEPNRTFSVNKPRLIADIGGTNARFALLHGSEIGESQVLQVDDYDKPADAIAAYLGGLPEGERPVEAAMGCRPAPLPATA
jgi:MFS family permease